jgi:hypothetical protein
MLNQPRLVATALLGLMLSGCGATGLAPLTARSADGFTAAAAAKEPANPFTDMVITTEAEKTGKHTGVSLSATNGAKLKVAVAIKDDELMSASVNRSVMVKDGLLVLGKEDEAAIAEAASEAGDEAKREARRRKSYLKVLGNLADGLKAAKVKKDQAKDVKAVVAALNAFIKDAQAPSDEAEDE